MVECQRIEKQYLGSTLGVGTKEQESAKEQEANTMVSWQNIVQVQVSIEGSLFNNINGEEYQLINWLERSEYVNTSVVTKII